MPCLSRAAPTSSGWPPSRTNVNALTISGAFPDHSEPGNEAHFPDGVAEQLALVGRDRWQAELAEVSMAAPSPIASAMLPAPASNLVGGD